MKVNLSVDIPITTKIYSGTNQAEVDAMIPPNAPRKITWSTNLATPGGTFIDSRGVSSVISPGDIVSRAGETVFIIKAVVNIATVTSQLV